MTSNQSPPAAPPDPVDIARRIAAGDERAEAELIEAYGHGILLLLERHTSGSEEAEDLYQETFRLAIEKLRRGELRDLKKLPGFLARMARNLAIEHYRKGARRKTDVDSETVGEVARVPSSQLERILESESAALVRQVIDALGNERDRQILYRFYIIEEDKARISADYGLSGLQFNRVLHRARQRYKDLFRSRVSPSAILAILLLGAISAVFGSLSR